MKFTSLISQIGKPQNVAEALVNRSTKWIAEHFGVTQRTAQKWKSGKGRKQADGTYKPQAPGKEVGGPERVKKSASAETRRMLATQAMRAATAINVGRIAVKDVSPKKGKPRQGVEYRNVGVVQLDPESRARIDEAARALDSGDTVRAEQLMSTAILRTAGKDYGGALVIADWPAHFHLI
jgi:hypothetical protein